jgi:hypothetical protein
VITSATARLFVGAFALMLLMSVAWAFATPIFGSPDENAHVTKAIGAARGDLLGHTIPDSRFRVFTLPDSYRYSSRLTCFAYQPQTTANCGVELGDPGGQSYFPSWVSANNPVYYAVVGTPSLFVGGSAGVYAMRSLSDAICCAMLAGALVAGMSGSRRRWMAAGLAFFASPEILFFFGAVNPQGLEIAAAALLTLSLLRLIEKNRHAASVALPLWSLWMGVVVGGSALAIARATGPLWVVVILALVAFVSGWRDFAALLRRAKNYVPIAILVAFGIFSLAWTLAAGTLSGQAEHSDAPLVGGSVLAGAWAMVERTPFFLQESMGIFGWEDTYLSGIVYAVYGGAVFLFLGLAIAGAERRSRIRIAVGLAMVLLVPVVVQAVSVSRTGIIWQGRYGMFLYLAAILVIAWLVSRGAPAVDGASVGSTLMIAGLVAVFDIAAFVVAVHRYTVGSGATLTKMFTAPAWQPPLGWEALAILLVLASAGFVVFLTRLARAATGTSPHVSSLLHD